MNSIRKIRKQHELESAVYLFRDRWFEMIPTSLIQKLELEDLTLVAAPYQECNNCGDVVVVDNKGIGICQACSKKYLSPYEDLQLHGPEHDYPCAHGYMFWDSGERLREDELYLVTQCGFFVYECELFNGYLLGIDGGGYSFIDEHWIPLYKALGLNWHEQE